MNKVSRCCKAEVIISTNLNNEIYGYMCTKCHKPCLIFDEDLVDELNKPISLEEILNKPMEKITKQEWQDHVAKNAHNSYSLAIELAIMDLWEAKIKTEEEGMERLKTDSLYLSGSQANLAIIFALAYDPSDWLNDDVGKIPEKDE